MRADGQAGGLVNRKAGGEAGRRVDGRLASGRRRSPFTIHTVPRPYRGQTPARQAVAVRPVRPIRSPPFDGAHQSVDCLSHAVPPGFLLPGWFATMRHPIGRPGV
ncbi:m22 protein [Murid betaherpesvirus 1]|uniref:M22 n=3 Tax=Murid herpesvirus 1 TaxID=10366 RepID=B3UWX2_MUHV1|nr:m22 [Muromegalovirus G4]ACE95530.1 m22 [Muromegalovirus C4A]QNL29164.1 m22 [Muromegalovirus G4]CCE57185.1 m22 protein [Murid betaherpesvirus 1]